MPLSALALALGAAVLHAAYNLVLARSRDTDATVAVAMVIGAAILAPLAVLRWRVEPAAWPYVAVSALLEGAYFAMLALAYRRADLSLVYPIARGLAPVLVLIVGYVALAQHVSFVQALGVIMVAGGVLLVRGFRAPAEWRDAALAVFIAALICGYTLVDQQGLRYADPLPYLVLVVAIPGVAYLAVILLRGGVPRVRAATTPSVVTAGVGVVSAYGMVLAALTLATAAAVAAVRETSVVIATALAAFVLHERVEPARWLGSVVVVVGIMLVVLG